MIVVAGEALVDIVVRPDATVEACLGGGPYNVARTVGRLGAEVRFLGMLSTDRFGQQFAAQLVDDGVGHDATLRTPLPTTLAVATTDPDGGATYTFYTAATSAPALEAVPSWPPPDAVHLGTLGLVLEPIRTTVMGYLAALGHTVMVMLDPNCRPQAIVDRPAYLTTLAAAYGHADVVKLSTDDVAYLAPGTPAAVYAREVLEFGPTAVLLTAGGRGTTVVARGGERTVPSPQAEVLDTIGAGDAFCGAFLTWWTEHASPADAPGGASALDDLDRLAEAVDAAQEVATQTCRRVGAQPPTRVELSHRWHR